MHKQKFDIFSLHSAYSSGISPREIIKECYRRLERANDPGIFLHLTDLNQALTEADALGKFNPKEKPLWGIPFAIKDNIDAAAAPTTAGCPAYSYVAETDAFVINVLRKAGAILVGKTNLDQFATGLVGVRSPYVPPKNAVDPQLVPGGSSSGSAIAVAHGIVSFALGTDTAGSGRVPAALNNIVGLKPSLGTLSNSGVVPACRTLDTISIFALTVEDSYRILSAAAVYDPADCYARKNQLTSKGALPPSIRVGIPDEASKLFYGDDIQAESFRNSLQTLKEIGGEIINIDFNTFYQTAALLYEGSWVAERYLTVEPLLKTAPEAIFPVTKQIIQAGEDLTAADTFRNFYRLQELRREADILLSGIDLLCVPSIPRFYSVQDVEKDPILPNSRLGTYTNFVNLLDMCGITVPTAPRSDNRPGSITFLAPAHKDSFVANVAQAMQSKSNATLGATGWSLPDLPLEDTLARDDEIEVAVVGAHMSGLPLNYQLTRLKGRFIRRAMTSPCYRLYSLPGGPPYRPGMIYQAQGTSINLEIWALPLENFGSFIKDIPPPLCIGTVRLENGTNVKGFLCEQHGLCEAQEISHLGGWRAYLSLKDSERHLENTLVT